MTGSITSDATLAVAAYRTSAEAYLSPPQRKKGSVPHQPRGRRYAFLTRKILKLKACVDYVRADLNKLKVPKFRAPPPSRHMEQHGFYQT